MLRWRAFKGRAFERKALSIDVFNSLCCRPEAVFFDTAHWHHPQRFASRRKIDIAVMKSPATNMLYQTSKRDVRGCAAYSLSINKAFLSCDANGMLKFTFSENYKEVKAVAQRFHFRTLIMYSGSTSICIREMPRISRDDFCFLLSQRSFDVIRGRSFRGE